MAENLADGEYWLPPQFLSDDEDSATIPLYPKHKPSFLNNGEDTLLFPTQFPYSFTSNLSSPVSSETESDEDEQQLAELTRRMAHSTLQTDAKSSNDNLGRFVSGSPKSTLCAIGSGCKCRKDSSHGSPNSVCNLSSSEATWDLLHAAAGEVERMRLNQQSFHNLNTNNNESFVPQRKPSPITLPSKNNTSTTTNSEMGFFTQQSLSHQQSQIAQFQMLKQQQMANQNPMWGVIQKQNRGVFQTNQMAQNSGRIDVNGVVDVRNTRPLGLSSSAWPTLQHASQQQIQNNQYGSRMRAVFIGNPSGRRESTGTGVFLPRCVNSPAESRKKPVCSTVLVPARVAQALNLKLDNYLEGCQPQYQHLHRFNSTPNVQNVAVAPRQMGNYAISQQKYSNINISSRPQPAVSNEIMLPQEWTY